MTLPHVHRLSHPLADLEAAHGLPTSYTDLETALAEALLGAAAAECATCRDQLEALVLRAGPGLPAHLLGWAWTLWRRHGAGTAPGAVAPVRPASAGLLHLMLTGRGERMAAAAAGLGPGVLAELLADVAALVPPTRTAATGAA